MELISATQLAVLGDIPDDWGVAAVADEFSIQLGKMLDSERNTGSPKPFLGNRAVQWGSIDVSDLGTMKMSPADLDRFRLRDGDLLACEGGEVGRAAIWRTQLGECYYQKALHRLRPRRGFSTELMLSILRFYSECGFFSEFVTQTSIAHLPKDKFETVPIPVPSPSEQQAIAGALSDADGLVESLERLLTKKRRLKLGAMQQLLTATRRLPGFEGEWEVVLLGEVASVKTGPFGTALHERDYVEYGTPIITVEHLGERGVQHFNLPRVSSSDYARLAAYILRVGDIVFSRVGSIDRNALIRDSENGWLFSGRLLRVRADKARVASAYLSYHFHGESFTNLVREVAVGQTMPSLNTRLLAGVEVSLPPFQEQRAIATVLSDMDAEITALEAKLEKARWLKQGMMQQLLTGRIRLV